MAWGNSVPDDRQEAWGRLLDDGDALLRRSRSAQQVAVDPGADDSGMVRVTLDRQGRVAAVTLTAGWRRNLGADRLPHAVLTAIRDAGQRRLIAWGEAYSGDQPVSGGAATASSGFDQADFQRRLQAVATASMSAADRQAALRELLDLARAVERGIDEISGKLHATLDATHVGHSPDRHVAATVTGGGEATAIRYDQAWLRAAHEINIGRQTTAAFHAAYQQVTAHGVHNLIADSPLGEVQRAAQDPLGLARRLHLSD